MGSIYGRFGPPKRRKPIFTNGMSKYVKTKPALESSIKSIIKYVPSRS